MIHSVGCQRDSLHETEGPGEVFELEHAVQLPLHAGPPIECGQARRNFSFGQLSFIHRAPMSQDVRVLGKLLSP